MIANPGSPKPASEDIKWAKARRKLFKELTAKYPYQPKIHSHRHKKMLSDTFVDTISHLPLDAL